MKNKDSNHFSLKLLTVNAKCPRYTFKEKAEKHRHTQKFELISVYLNNISFLFEQ